MRRPIEPPWATTPIDCGGPDAGRSRVGRPRESWPRESDGGERCLDRRPARGCQEQTHVLAEQCSRMERDAFHGPYLSAKIPEAAWYKSAVQEKARVGARGVQAERHFFVFDLELRRLWHRTISAVPRRDPEPLGDLILGIPG